MPWPGWDSAQRWYFRHAASAGFSAIGPGDVTFEAVPDRRGIDTRMLVREPSGTWTCALDSKLFGLLPAAIFLGLSAASSLGRPLRWQRWALGVLALHAYVFARLLVTYGQYLTRHVAATPERDHEHAAFLRSAGWMRTIDTIANLDRGIALLALAPVLIWLATLPAREVIGSREGGGKEPMEPEEPAAAGGTSRAQ